MKKIGSTCGILLLVGACASQPKTPAAPAPEPTPVAEVEVAQRPGRVFVAKVSAPTADTGLAEMAASALTRALARHFPAGVTSQGELANMVQHALISGTLGVEEATQLRDFADQVEADYVAVGSLSRAGDVVSLSVAIFDAEQKRVVNRISERRADPEALLAAIEPAVRAMYDLPARVTKADIVALIRSKMGLVKYCYNRQLETDPTLQGKAVVRFEIQPDGTVTGVELDRGESTLNTDAFATCIEVAIMSLNLGFQIEKRVEVAYPFIFKLQD